MSKLILILGLLLTKMCTFTTVAQENFNETEMGISSVESKFPERCSFSANDISLTEAMILFCQSNGFGVRFEAPINEKISISFKNKTFENAIKTILGNRGLKWSLDDNDIVVFTNTKVAQVEYAELVTTPEIASSIVTIREDGSRLFKIDYPRIKRSAQGSSTASISSQSSGEAGNIQLSTTDEIFFWQELDEQLKQLLSPTGKMIMNRMSGIINVIDETKNLDHIESFLKAVVPAATRQIEITARIYEISLDKDHSLGIDWSALSGMISQGGVSGEVSGAMNLEQSNSQLKTSTLKVDLSIDNRITAVVNALKEQGDVQIISQPRILTLNNQPALIKIGTDYPYFSSTVTTNPTTNQREVQEEVRIITVGVILSVTPQASDNGWITMGIDPLISDLISTVESEGGSTAPVIDVKQSSALIRLKDRTTVRISGLIQNKKSVMQRKVPLLGDIPLLKYLFKWSYTKNSRKELVIFITPRIIK